MTGSTYQLTYYPECEQWFEPHGFRVEPGQQLRVSVSTPANIGIYTPREYEQRFRGEPHRLAGAAVFAEGTYTMNLDGRIGHLFVVVSATRPLICPKESKTVSKEFAKYAGFTNEDINASVCICWPQYRRAQNTSYSPGQVSRSPEPERTVAYDSASKGMPGTGVNAIGINAIGSGATGSAREGNGLPN